jgi:4-hydroxy-4-methyl-2-oxoglutarate aldolase
MIDGSAPILPPASCSVALGSVRAAATTAALTRSMSRRVVVGTSSGRRGSGFAGPVAAAFACCGPALTVHSPPGDNLWLHRALAIAQPGDVLVVHVSGAHEHGYWGEIMSTMARARGLAGLVIDGCVRDGVLLGEIGFPVFARGLCIRGTGKDAGATGWINAPVLIGDVVVSAGDLVVGDGDGVVVVPRARAGEVVDKARRRESDEAAILPRLRAGESTLQVYGFQ